MGQNSGTRTGYSGEHQSSWENMDVHHSKLWYHRIEMVWTRLHKYMSMGLYLYKHVDI